MWIFNPGFSNAEANYYLCASWHFILTLSKQYGSGEHSILRRLNLIIFFSHIFEVIIIPFYFQWIQQIQTEKFPLVFFYTFFYRSDPGFILTVVCMTTVPFVTTQLICLTSLWSKLSFVSYSFIKWKD